jgi:hypothetical protein
MLVKPTLYFLLALFSDYDQVLFEDRKENRMKESLLLFGDACNSVVRSLSTNYIFSHALFPLLVVPSISADFVFEQMRSFPR